MSLSLSSRRAPQALRSGGFPRIDLLPPEVKAAGRLRQTQTTLLLALVIILAVVAAAIYWSVVQVQTANDRLADEQARTAEILAQQAEYADVPIVTGLLASAAQAQQVGASTEVSVDEVLLVFAALLPDESTFTSWAFVEGTPIRAYDGNTNVLGESAVAHAAYAVVGTDPDALTNWVDRIERVPGVAGQFVESLAHDADTNGYTLTGTIWFTSDIYSGRYQPEAEADDEGSEG